ncbi:MAG: heavy metal translocating P-type ATPase [Leptolyngbya foveolarum]|uniref:Heavy metal translocating P-type ATPase n=1 Tax=Leptolyngbya foveolarum TaxID=47253 RepID=A0A2W4TTH4_9CYAN|nr:MAG: heavy metal translocating P-type ATPase [Leptolyngbya foveolarum]
MTSLVSTPWQKQAKSWIRDYPEVIAALICAILTLSGWLALNGNWLGGGIWILIAAYIIGGYASTREGLTTLWQERELDVDLLMIVAALGAATLGLWQQEYYLLVDGAVLILIFAISGALEGIAMHRTERNIRGLMQLTSDTARRLQSGQEESVAVQRLKVGDRILVKPGELIPADGILKEGYSTVNQAPITGESIPVEKTLGDEVFAGTINGSGAIVLELHKPPESNLIQRVIRLVETAKTTQPPSQQFLERFERGYAKVIVVTALLLVILPPLLLNWDWETTIYRALVFLVVASPCALMAAIMPALLSGIAQGARQGILFKDGAQLEMIGKVRAIAFDKTGTLTTGKLQVCDIVPANGTTPEQVLQIAASLEAYSEHPIAQAIVSAAQKQSLPLLSATSVQAQVGLGITGLSAEKTLKIGKRSLVEADLTSPTETNLIQTSSRIEAEGKTVIWVSQQNRMMGLLAVADRIRPESSRLIGVLKRLGVKATVMLTGDNAATAQTIGQAAGVDRVYSDLLPEDKVDVIHKLQQQYQIVAMVGDGINDAPALAQASVGIAMGGTGSDIALETADVVLMADRLEKLEQAIQIGVKSQQIIKQNITLALISVAVLIVANFFGELTLPAGVLGHEGSTLLVTLNGMRLLSPGQDKVREL